MKNSLLFLLGILLSTTGISQTTQQSKQIYFEGVIKSEATWNGIFSFDVIISKGTLAGKTETFYFSTIMSDPKQIECKGNAQIQGDGSSNGKKIKGKVIMSTGSFENYNTGGIKSKPCYRPTEINWL
jgi:hypothetical protein